MSPTAPAGNGAGMAERLGLKPGMIVMESGYDDDADEDLRADVARCTGEQMVPEDTDEVANATTTIEARAQARKPCAVSRKKTSSVCTPTHFVRSRPAT